MMRTCAPVFAALLASTGHACAAQEAQPLTAAIAFAMPPGEEPSPDRRSSVGLRLGAGRIWEAGTDFSAPLAVPAAGPVEMFLVPSTGVDTRGVGGAFRVTLSAGGTVSVPVTATPSVPVHLLLSTAEGVAIPRTSVTVYDVTYRDRGYTNENWVADCSAAGEFSFHGHPGDVYELRLVLADRPQRPELVFPPITVGKTAIDQHVAAIPVPRIDFTFVERRDGKDQPLGGERQVTYQQDNNNTPQRLPMRDGALELLLVHDVTGLDGAKTVTLSLPGYALEPATIQVGAALGKAQVIHCTPQAEAKPTPAAASTLPIVVNLSDGSDQPVQGGAVLILKREVGAAGHADFTYLRTTPTDATGRFECQADPHPFVGYLLYSIKVGGADAVYSKKALIAPGTPCDLKIAGTPRRLAVTVANLPATPERRAFLLVDAATWRPVSGALMRKDAQGTLAFAAFPGKYRILFVRDRTGMQLLGEIAVDDGSPDPLAVALDWSALKDVDAKTIESAQQADFAKP